MCFLHITLKTMHTQITAVETMPVLLWTPSMSLAMRGSLRINNNTRGNLYTSFFRYPTLGPGFPGRPCGPGAPFGPCGPGF